MDPATIVTIFSCLFGVGGIAAILKARADSKKTAAEAEITLTGGWKVLYEASRGEVAELRERVAIVEHKEEECQTRLAKLEKVSGLDVEKTVAALIEKEIFKREGGQSGGRKPARTSPRAKRT